MGSDDTPVQMLNRQACCVLKLTARQRKVVRRQYRRVLARREELHSLRERFRPKPAA